MSGLQVYPDLDALVTGAADYIADLAVRCIVERGRFTLALAGGSTPRPPPRPPRGEIHVTLCCPHPIAAVTRANETGCSAHRQAEYVLLHKSALRVASELHDCSCHVQRHDGVRSRLGFGLL